MARASVPVNASCDEVELASTGGVVEAEPPVPLPERGTIEELPDDRVGSVGGVVHTAGAVVLTELSAAVALVVPTALAGAAQRTADRRTAPPPARTPLSDARMIVSFLEIVALAPLLCEMGVTRSIQFGGVRLQRVFVFDSHDHGMW